MGRHQRRAAELGDLFEGLGRHLRDIDDHTQVVKAMHGLLADLGKAVEGVGRIVEER
ncbi:hypothetical protein D3C76_1778040 [compost metagenome]